MIRLKSIIFFLMLIIPSFTIKAQETEQTTLSWSGQWKHAFSAEGRNNWRPEFTARVTAGFVYDNTAFTAGIRIDDKRTLGLMFGSDNVYYDSIPGDCDSYFAGLYMRRYFHTGKRQRLSFYSDISLGAGLVYQATPGVDEEKDDIVLFWTWQPGVRIRFWKNTQLFLGPSVGPRDFGLHIGVGF